MRNRFGPRRRFSGDRFLIFAFMLLVAPLGVCLAVLTPPGQVADEPAHVARAAALLHGAVIGMRRMTIANGRAVPDAGVRADIGLLQASLFPSTPVTPANLAARRAARWAGSLVFMSISPLAIYFPVFYVPAAIGIGAAHLLGFLPFRAIEAGRLVSFAVYLALGLAALTLARRGQAVLFLALALPMTVSLGASCNPDGLLIATAALGCALVSRAAGLGAAVCFAAVILVKPPYALLALLLLPRWRLVALSVLPGAVWFFYAMIFVAAPALWPAYHGGTLWPGDPNRLFYATDVAAQLRVVCAHPLTVAAMVWTNIVADPLLWREIVGVFGWLNIFLPAPLYTVWAVAAGGALAAEVLAPRERHALLGPLAVFVMAGSVLLVWLSQYLTWTPVGLAAIYGPTGRYLLPLIPVLALAVPQLGGRWAVWLRGVALALPAAAAAMGLFWLPGLLRAHFGG